MCLPQAWLTKLPFSPLLQNKIVQQSLNSLLLQRSKSALDTVHRSFPFPGQGDWGRGMYMISLLWFSVWIYGLNPCFWQSPLRQRLASHAVVLCHSPWDRFDVSREVSNLVLFHSSFQEGEVKLILGGIFFLLQGQGQAILGYFLQPHSGCLMVILPVLAGKQEKSF